MTALLALLLCLSTEAEAATYDVVSCAETPTGVNNAWVAFNDSPETLATIDRCPSHSPATLVLSVTDRLDSADTPNGSASGWLFAAPAGTRVARLRYVRLLGKRDSSAWKPELRTASGHVVETCELSYPQSQCEVGGSGTHPRDTGELDTTSLRFGIRCVTVFMDCTNGYSLHHAWAAIYSSRVTISDETLPTVGQPTGELMASGWQQGQRSVTAGGSDSTGIREMRLYVDGVRRDVRARVCDYTRPAPCTGEPAASLSVDTRVLGDGQHEFQVAAVDAAGNERRSPERSFLVDNDPPSAPRDLAIVGGDEVRQENDFEVSWTNPPDAGAPVAAAHWRLCRESTMDCSTTRTASAGISRISGIRLPAAGSYTLTVRLEDALGHTSEAASSAPVTLRLGVDSPARSDPSLDEGSPAVSPAPAPVARQAARLRIRTLRLSGRQLRIAGSLATGAHGRLRANYVATVRGRRLVRRREVPVTGGRYSMQLTLPAGAAARGIRGKLTVRYGGDAGHRPQTLQRSIRAR
jgi:hypothetical protein